MLTTLRAEVSARLSEVLSLIDLIRHLESAPPTPDPREAKILRGLFHVHLYGALEYTVNEGVQRFLQATNSLSIAPRHLEARFCSVALDPSFTSIRNVGEDKRWPARLKVIDLQTSPNPQPINVDVFGLYLQNVWAEKLEVLFKCLNINEPVVPDHTFRLYIDELVERRNEVAHGRMSALGIGSARRSPDLLVRYNAISATCFYILDCFERHHQTRTLVIEAHRPEYP
jgi:RiboL-PSP-HEPN